MPTPFPGMDPSLEHPVLWPSVHVRLIVTIGDQIAPLLRPRYVVSVEERVFLDRPEEDRVPDAWIQRAQQGFSPANPQGQPRGATPVVLEVERLEIREHYLEILDLYRDKKVVTVVEMISPTNKRSGPGRRSYRKKQHATLTSDTHLVEIDLLRTGRHVLGVPYSRLRKAPHYDYLISANRAPKRNRFELYPILLRERLPEFRIPLAGPDEHVLLDLQSAFERVYDMGSYMLRVKYDEPCVPPLEAADQQWANECWSAYRKAHPEFCPDTTPDSGRPTNA